MGFSLYLYKATFAYGPHLSPLYPETVPLGQIRCSLLLLYLLYHHILTQTSPFPTLKIAPGGHLLLFPA